MNRQRFLLPALLTLTLARLLFLPLHELSEVERHVLESSKAEGIWHASLGPILPLLVRATTAVFGESAFGVRLLAPFLMLGAGWVFWKLARGMFDATTASWAVAIFQLTPAVNVAGVTMTLTTVGIASAALVLLALRHALHREHRWRLQWWALAGALVLAILVDWRLFMLAVSCVAVMALTQRGQRALMKWPVLPILGLSVGLTLTFFVAWNSEHGWPAFAPFPGIAPPTPWQFTLHVLLAVSPLLLAAYGWSLARSAARRPMEYAVAFTYAFTWPLVTLDLLSWMVLPWPHGGFGAWIGPAAMLLAQHTMVQERAPLRAVIVGRWVALAAAAIQGWVLLQRGLENVHSLPW